MFIVHSFFFKSFDMRLFTTIFLVLTFSSLYGQNVFPYIDNIGYMRSFQNGKAVQIEYLEPRDVKFSEKIIAFIDNKRDFFVFDGEKKEMLASLVNGYQIGYNLCAWNTGPILSVWDSGKKRELTRFGRNYQVSDSIVVFEDLRDNAIRVYYNDSIYNLFYSVDVPMFPQAIGSNSVAFVGNGNIHYAFISGKIVEIGVINDQVSYSAGANKVAFNDPFHQSFACAHATEIVDIESIMIQDYQAGWDIVAYRDLNDQLMLYKNDGIIELSNYSARNYQVFRNMVVWDEAGLLFVYDGNLKQKFEVANYIPVDYKIRDGIVAFRNLNGGVSVYDNGEVKVISNLQNAPFEVNGSMVRVQVNRGNFDFYQNGEIWNK